MYRISNIYYIFASEKAKYLELNQIKKIKSNQFFQPINNLL